MKPLKTHAAAVEEDVATEDVDAGHRLVEFERLAVGDGRLLLGRQVERPRWILDIGGGEGLEQRGRIGQPAGLDDDVDAVTISAPQQGAFCSLLTVGRYIRSHLSGFCCQAL